MGGGKKRKLRSEDEARQLVELAQKCLSELHHFIPFVPSASGSVGTEGDTFLHESEDESEAERRPKKITLCGLYLQGLVEELLQTDTFRAPQKIQLDSHSSSSTPGLQKGLVDVDSSVPPSFSTQPPPTPCFPPYPAGGKPEEIMNWRMECIKVRKAHDKALKKVLSSESGNNLPTLEALQYNGSINAVQDWRSKQAVLAAARSIVSITPISDDGPIGSQCTGFILCRYEYAGVAFSVIVTCSAVVCNTGRKLDPLPKLSVSLPDQKTVIEAHLLYFNDHFDIAFLLLPMELSLNIPRLGCCPDYNQEVFVLGRDRKAFLRVTHGVISWTEESDFMGRDHYMFLDGWHGWTCD